MSAVQLRFEVKGEGEGRDRDLKICFGYYDPYLSMLANGVDDEYLYHYILEIESGRNDLRNEYTEN